MPILVKLLPYVLIFIAGFFVSSQIAENRLTRELAKQESEFNQKLVDMQAREKESSDAYQAKITALSGSASKLRKLYASNRCRTISTSTSGSNGSPAAGIVSGSPQVDSGELIDLAEDAEKVRLQLIALQDFINGK
jgi:hypothetical protein